MLIERALQKMSRKLDKPIMFREAVERFFTEFLADGKTFWPVGSSKSHWF